MDRDLDNCRVLVSRYAQHDVFKIEDQAEQRVLRDMCAHLEAVLSEPFRADYDLILGAARDDPDVPRDAATVPPGVARLVR